MSSSRTPILRSITKDTRTGELRHRKSVGHIGLSRNGTPNLGKSPRNSNPSLEKTKTKKEPKMPTAETQTDVSPPLRDDELHQKIDGLTSQFDKVEKTCEDYKTSLEFTQEEVRDLKEENTALKETLKELSLEIKRNTFAIQKLGTRQENMETNARKKNLIFEGVPEPREGRENLCDTVCQILSEMGINKPIDYDATYRLGQRPGKYPRPLLVSFIRVDDRNLVFSRRAQLRNFTKVWLSEDVTPRTRRSRNVIREVAKEARNQGARCLATPSSVIIDNVKYTEENLDDLPSEYAVEKTKMKKLGDTIAYGSEHAPFSNLYPAKVPMMKKEYLCSEQAFRHIRATENNKPNIAARIWWSRDPYEMMDMDRNMELSAEWRKKEDFVLFKCIFRKYEHNADLREILLSTGDMELAEATRSTRWATGATINSNAMKNHTWTGENRQGKHSMKVRDYFKLNTDEYADSRSYEPVSDSFLEHLYTEE